MKFLSFIVLSVFIFHSDFVQSQQCQEIPFTDLNLSITEANYCFECNRSSANSLFKLNNISLHAPEYSCFENSIKHRGRGSNTFCQGNQLYSSNVSICPSQQYIKTTAQAFYDVTQCLDIKDPAYFYALINRESRFQISAKSHTGATCYGQLTAVAIADINQRFIPIETPNANSDYCTSIMENFSKLDVKKRGSGRNTRYSKTPEAVCNMVSKPHSCMTYSAIFYKKLLEDAQNRINKLNYVTAKFKNSSDMYYFIDENEYQKFLRENPNLVLKKGYPIKKSIFQNPEFVAQTLAWQAYNGGNSVLSLFSNYTNTVKHLSWNNKKDYQKQIFSSKPTGIHSSDFVKTFKNYTLKYSKGPNRRENASFVSDILTDYRSVTRNEIKNCGNLPVKNLQAKRRFTARDL